MLEVAKEAFLQWDIRVLDSLVFGHGGPPGLLELGL